MQSNLSKIFLFRLSVISLSIALIASTSFAQNTRPLTQAEFIAMVTRLSSQPDNLPNVIEELRSRGIGFEVTRGIRSVVATRSRNDATLRRTLDEAERRRLNPNNSTVPPAAESAALLEEARAATLAAAEGLPDFLVKQLVTRSYARGTSKSWITSDRLTVLVSYREGLGERYKLMFKNDQAVTDEGERGSYAQTEGTTSTGEFASRLTALFAPETQAEFKAVDTDILRDRRTIVYEYTVKQSNSKHRISAAAPGGVTEAEAVIVGYQGKIWIDRETRRVLRLESTAVDIPTSFPVSAAVSRIDYDWATINNKRYLMPLRAELELTAGREQNIVQTRNDIRFRNYRKFGSALEIIIDDDDDVEPPPGN